MMTNFCSRLIFLSQYGNKMCVSLRRHGCGYNRIMHVYFPHPLLVSLCRAGAVTTALCAHPPPHIPLQHISPPHIPSTWHDWQVAFVIIAKHFGSVGVERTCCVADWQKNIGIRKYANLLSYGTQDSHEGDEDSDEGPEINEADEGNNSERQVKEREG